MYHCTIVSKHSIFDKGPLCLKQEHTHNIQHMSMQVSCVSSSSELTNRTRYLYHFGVLATEANLAFGFYSIIHHYNWSRVVILLQEENLFIVVGHTATD